MRSDGHRNICKSLRLTGRLRAKASRAEAPARWDFGRRVAAQKVDPSEPHQRGMQNNIIHCMSIDIVRRFDHAVNRCDIFAMHPSGSIQSCDRTAHRLPPNSSREMEIAAF